MDKSLIEKYKDEMMGMYFSSRKTSQRKDSISQKEIKMTMAEMSPAEADNTGKLIVTVTTVRSLYPVENAKVTVFSGDIENKNPIETDFTDQSGRTKAFVLETPPKNISLDSLNTKLPYELYGIEISAEGQPQFNR